MFLLLSAAAGAPIKPCLKRKKKRYVEREDKIRKDPEYGKIRLRSMETS